jgi:hypothetical protein
MAVMVTSGSVGFGSVILARGFGDVAGVAAHLGPIFVVLQPGGSAVAAHRRRPQEPVLYWLRDPFRVRTVLLGPGTAFMCAFTSHPAPLRGGSSEDDWGVPPVFGVPP